MVKNHAYNMCYPVCLWKYSVRDESVHALWGAVGLVPCLVLRCCIFFLPVVGAECDTGLLLWLCRHPKLSTVRRVIIRKVYFKQKCNLTLDTFRCFCKQYHCRYVIVLLGH